MASLKDMRVRIASTRRRRRSPRPCRWSRLQAAPGAGGGGSRAPVRPSAWIACSATSLPASPAAIPRHACSPALAPIKFTCLVVCTAERGLCGAFKLLDRASGARADQRAARARQRGQDSLRWPQGRRSTPPRLWQIHYRSRRVTRRQADGLRPGTDGRRQDHRALRQQRIRRRDRVLSRASSR